MRVLAVDDGRDALLTAADSALQRARADGRNVVGVEPQPSP